LPPANPASTGLAVVVKFFRNAWTSAADKELPQL
jgi:hypothetical protein